MPVRDQWNCKDCDGPFLYATGATPNFCPYCRSQRLAKYVEPITYSARRSGKTERLREEVKAAIDEGKNVYLTDAPPAASTDGDNREGGDKNDNTA